MSAEEKDLDLRAVYVLDPLAGVLLLLCPPTAAVATTPATLTSWVACARGPPAGPQLFLRPTTVAVTISPPRTRAEIGLLESAFRTSGRARGRGLGGPSPVAAGPHDVARDGGAVMSGGATILLLLKRMPLLVLLSPLTMMPGAVRSVRAAAAASARLPRRAL